MPFAHRKRALPSVMWEQIDLCVKQCQTERRVTLQMGLNLKHLVSETIWYDRINCHKSNVDVLFRTSAHEKGGNALSMRPSVNTADVTRKPVNSGCFSLMRRRNCDGEGARYPKQQQMRGNVLAKKKKKKIQKKLCVRSSSMFTVRARFIWMDSQTFSLPRKLLNACRASNTY